MSPVDQIRTYWDRRARDCATDAERVDSTARSQRARFADVERAILGARSVLDVGCGVGDLCGYLRGLGYRIDYRGVDISPEMVNRARWKHSAGIFEVGNIVEWDDEPLADAVVAVGLHSLPIDGAAEWLETILRKQYGFCRQVVYANFLSANYPHAPEVKAWKPADVLAVASRITPWVALNHDYLPHDFSVTMRRGQR